MRRRARGPAPLYSYGVFRRLFLLLLLFAVACTSAAPLEPTTPEPPPPPPRDAHEIAAQLVAANVLATVHFDKAKDHPLANRVAKFELWGELFEAAEIDPKTDLLRACVAAANVRDGEQAIAVVEHGLSADKARAAIDTLVAKKNGTWIDGAEVPTAQVVLRGRVTVLALPTDNLLLILPPQRAADAVRFRGSGGLPEHDGPEIVMARAADPATTLKTARAPSIPDTISEATTTVVLTADGGATVRVEGLSQNALQAKQDAETLTDRIDKATSVKISVVRIRLFERVVFKAEEDRVVAERTLSKERLEQLFELATNFM